ncbi:hypothetical protein SHVI106290_11210 [Shewanella violacea]
MDSGQQECRKDEIEEHWTRRFAVMTSMGQGGNVDLWRL